MNFSFRSKGKNKNKKIKCNRHKKGLDIFGVPTYDLLDEKGEPCGVICWRCGKNLPIFKEKPKNEGTTGATTRV